MKLMIVDDSSTMRKIVLMALKSFQAETVEAENGQEALEKLSSGKVDLFIVDVNMPVMNGIDLVKNLRAKPDYSRTPILMLTTESDTAMIEQGKAAGANEWIVKPFKNEEFVSTLHKLGL